ncbi:fam-l protein [Plasmodium malariae]|uniref:Fam-l protein n=1 Tax=Plasmodium malariae TaxID=5858 RepID=A0A1D3JN81_PLAMA|nr:fam-l protein [Plasmodium malariae]SBT88035.1 fam-l protein [Plasmodium malariae]
MEQKISLLFFIKYALFIISTWMYYLRSDLRTFKKTFCEFYKLDGKLRTRRYRLLAKYKQNKNSNTVELMEGISNSKVNVIKDFSNNEKGSIEKKKQLNKSSLNSSGIHDESLKYKPFIFETKNYSYFEKKIFKELDNTEFLIRNRTMSNRTYKKIKFEKRRLRFSLGLLLLILVLAVPLIDFFFYFACGKEILSELGLLSIDNMGLKSYFPRVGGWLKNVLGLENTMFRGVIKIRSILEYCVPILIIFVVIILCIVYYYKKVMKYEKLKFRKKLKEY